MIMTSARKDYENVRRLYQVSYALSECTHYDRITQHFVYQRSILLSSISITLLLLLTVVKSLASSNYEDAFNSAIWSIVIVQMCFSIYVMVVSRKSIFRHVFRPFAYWPVQRLKQSMDRLYNEYVQAASVGDAEALRSDWRAIDDIRLDFCRSFTAEINRVLATDAMKAEFRQARYLNISVHQGGDVPGFELRFLFKDRRVAEVSFGHLAEP